MLTEVLEMRLVQSFGELSEQVSGAEVEPRNRARG